MSTYIDTVHPDRHAPYLDIPNLVVDYLHYLDFVRQNSPRTINGYYLDLRGFFRYMMVVWGLASEDTPPEKVDLTHITKEQISKIKKRDVLNYLDYARSQDNGPRARARASYPHFVVFLTICATRSTNLKKTPLSTSAWAPQKRACPDI